RAGEGSSIFLARWTLRYRRGTGVVEERVPRNSTRRWGRNLPGSALGFAHFPLATQLFRSEFHDWITPAVSVVTRIVQARWMLYAAGVVVPLKPVAVTLP